MLLPSPLHGTRGNRSNRGPESGWASDAPGGRMHIEFELGPVEAQVNDVARHQFDAAADALRVDVGSIAGTQVADPEIAAHDGNPGVSTADKMVLVPVERNLTTPIASEGDLRELGDRKFLGGSGLARVAETKDNFLFHVASTPYSGSAAQNASQNFGIAHLRSTIGTA